MRGVRRRWRTCPGRAACSGAWPRAPAPRPRAADVGSCAARRATAREGHVARGRCRARTRARPRCSRSPGSASSISDARRRTLSLMSRAASSVAPPLVDRAAARPRAQAVGHRRGVAPDDDDVVRGRCRARRPRSGRSSSRGPARGCAARRPRARARRARPGSRPCRSRTSSPSAARPATAARRPTARPRRPRRARGGRPARAAPRSRPARASSRSSPRAGRACRRSRRSRTRGRRRWCRGSSRTRLRRRISSGVEAQALGEVVHRPLDPQAGDHPADAAVGAHRRLVGDHGGDVAPVAGMS